MTMDHDNKRTNSAHETLKKAALAMHFRTLLLDEVTHVLELFRCHNIHPRCHDVTTLAVIRRAKVA